MNARTCPHSGIARGGDKAPSRAPSPALDEWKLLGADGMNPGGSIPRRDMGKLVLECRQGKPPEDFAEGTKRTPSEKQEGSGLERRPSRHRLSEN